MIVDYLPRGVTVRPPGAPTPGRRGGLRASGRMLEIGVDELALDEREAGMLAALDGRELQPHEARELHARTEGWPAAVYLAARRAHRVRGGGPAAAVRVSGRDTDIGDYLDAELLDHATPRVRTFLLQTAVPTGCRRTCATPSSTGRAPTGSCETSPRPTSWSCP